MSAQVICRSESAYAEYPQAFNWQGRLLNIIEVTQRWRTPDELLFQALASDTRVYLLHYRLLEDDWQVEEA